MTIISPDTIYTEVSLADEERVLLRRLLREELTRHARYGVQRHFPLGIAEGSIDMEWVSFVTGVIDKLEV